MNYNPNKFTLRAQEAVQTAAQKAASLQHQQIEPEHVLLALLSDKNNIAYQLSEKLGLQTEQIITILERQIDRFPKVSGASVSGQYLSPNLSKIFDLAATQAEKLKDEYIVRSIYLLQC
jgi:ATPases with chaperone activity, ATP-binding subunit